MRSGQPPPYALIAVAMAALALLALWRFLVRLKRDRLVADTPEVRIRSAAQGYVKVKGRTQPAGPAPTAAPLSEAALERREKLFAGLYLALGLVGVLVCAWAIRHIA